MYNTQHKEISVFLASSEELKQDRIAFGDFIRRLSDIFEKRGLCIKLKKWEDFDAAYNGCRKQDEYNACVRDSNIFLALFYKKAGEYTVEEFNVALKEFGRTGIKPKIYVFCKDLGEGEEQSDELKKIKSSLNNNLGYFWGHYNNTDSLHLGFVMQLLLFENNLAEKLKVENGEVMIDGFSVATMDKLSFVTNNSDYQRIKRRIKELSVLIENERFKVDKNPDNKESRDELQSHLDEKNELQNKLVQEQNLLIETAKRINSLQTSAITERMRQAIDAFENGDAHKANIILDGTEYDADCNLSDYLQSQALANQNREKAILSIEELLLKASVCLSDASVNIEDRVDKVRNLYIKADEIAFNLNYDSGKYYNLLFSFTSFLDKYGFYDEAIKILSRQIHLAKKLFGFYSTAVSSSYNRLGTVCRKKGLFTLSKEFYNKARIIRENLYGINNRDTIETYIDIGLLNWEQKKYATALDYYKIALEVLEKNYGKEDSKTAETYNNIGGVYWGTREYKKALDYFIIALNIKMKLAVPDQSSIAITYNNIGMIYDEMKDYDMAVYYHNKAMEIKRKTLGELHPSMAVSYNNLGRVFYKKHNYVEALCYLTKAQELFNTKLRKNHPYSLQTQEWINKTRLAMKEEEII